MDYNGIVKNPDEERYNVYLRNEDNEFAKDIKPTQADIE